MVSPETILATYIDVNLLMAGTALVWFFARKLFDKPNVSLSFPAQLGFLKLLILLSFALPVVLTLFAIPLGGAPIAPVSLSELVLSQYLQGNVQLNPGMLESVLTVRQNLMTQLTDPNHPIVLAILAGAFLTALFMIVRTSLTFLKLRNVLALAHDWRSFGTLKFKLSDTVRIPFSTRGLRNQYIVLPSDMLAHTVDSRVALLHELQHLRQRDVEWEFAAALLTPVFFWNPAFHYFRREIEELRELTCDQQVLAKGRLTPRQYCECLLRVCAGKFQRPSLFQLRIPEVALIETYQGFFGNRPKRLLSNRLTKAFEKPVLTSSRTSLMVTCAILVCSTLVLSLTVQKPSDWSHDRLMLSTIINLERLEQRNRLGLGTYRSY